MFFKCKVDKQIGKIIWIIGGSSGIGFELAKKYLQNENRVIVSSRSAESSSELIELSKIYSDNLSLIDIDVLDFESVLEASKKAWELYSRIDICFYNAGSYETMKVENWNMSHFETMTQTNYLGGVRVINAMMPYFSMQKQGHFVFNLSISSYVGLPYGGGYSAPKAALLNLCESLQPELAKKDIKVQVINHGFVKTRLTAKNNFEMPQLLSPIQASERIYSELQKAYRFEIRFPFIITTFLTVLRMLPYKIALKITSKAL